MNKKQRIAELEAQLAGIKNYVEYQMDLPLTLSKKVAVGTLETVANMAGGLGNYGRLARRWAAIDVKLVLEKARYRVEQLKSDHDRNH